MKEKEKNEKNNSLTNMKNVKCYSSTAGNAQCSNNSGVTLVLGAKAEISLNMDHHFIHACHRRDHRAGSQQKLLVIDQSVYQGEVT